MDDTGDLTDKLIEHPEIVRFRSDPSTRSKVFVQKYRCTKCGADDNAKLFENEAKPIAINCWQCGRGRGMGVDQMIESGMGMRPLGDMTLRDAEEDGRIAAGPGPRSIN